jgi:acyl-CoA synthetase (AMP-forming)/AMP-acid ligase II
VETIWSLFEEAERRHAAAPAAVEGDVRLTYAELGAHVRALALRLQETGIRPGERVAILEANTSAYLAAYFAAPCVGAVLVPLNTRLAPRELAEILADAEARVLLSTGAFAGTLAALAAAVPTCTVLRLEDAAAARSTSAAPQPRPPAPDDLAQLYYTSGTTGRAKGVMLTHANVCTHARSAIAELGLSRADRWGHFAPMFHLADAWASFALTAVGGLHVLAPRFEPGAALALVEREGITITNLVPTMLARMVDDPIARTFDPSSLRRILSGGAPIAPALVERIMQVFRCEYVQTYGMTETSPYLTLSLLHPHLERLAPAEQLRYRARTGRPFAGVELEVVDEAGRPVPRDDASVGEIRVRGPTVTRGYWRRPAETAAALRDGWLYTGDLAVIDAEGYVNIVDRKKDMILTGGENVYSTEVEHALCSHPAVLEAAAFGVPDPTWGEAVRAAVVLKRGARASAEELAAHCRTRIAGYKVPRAIELREELPRTGSGKLAKNVLREEARARSAAAAPGAEPRS